MDPWSRFHVLCSRHLIPGLSLCTDHTWDLYCSELSWTFFFSCVLISSPVLRGSPPSWPAFSPLTLQSALFEVWLFYLVSLDFCLGSLSSSGLPGKPLWLPPGPAEVFLDRTRKAPLSDPCHSLVLCFLMASKPSETERDTLCLFCT